jgi:hypothetical protein
VGQQEGGVVELAGERLVEQAQSPSGGVVGGAVGAVSDLCGELVVFPCPAS